MFKYFGFFSILQPWRDTGAEMIRHGPRSRSTDKYPYYSQVKVCLPVFFVNNARAPARPPSSLAERRTLNYIKLRSKKKMIGYFQKHRARHFLEAQILAQNASLHLSHPEATIAVTNDLIAGRAAILDVT